MTVSPKRQIGMVFPGQGSQHVGMLSELAASYPVVIETFATASDVLGYDLWELVQKGPAEQLSLTHITQPAILTSSVAVWRIWQAKGGAQPALMAGHSLGEYSALVCAGALEFAAAVDLVRQRGQFMQNAVPLGTGTMAAVLGLEDSVVEQCCHEASKVGAVAPANYNSPGQLVIAGHTAAVEAALSLCKAAGAKRAMLLAVSAPFHSPLMKPAADEFEKVLANVSVRSPSIPVIQNVGLRASEDPAVIKRNLVEQIASPVPWVATMNLFARQQVTQLYEIGPGKVLAGLNKRINPELETVAVNDASSLSQAMDIP